MTDFKAIEPKLMVEPTHWLAQGIQLDSEGRLPLFRFTETLQTRSDELIALSKSRTLSAEEQAELDSLSQLSQIFTYANSLLAASILWSPPRSENSLPSEPQPVANTATPQNL